MSLTPASVIRVNQPEDAAAIADVLAKAIAGTPVGTHLGLRRGVTRRLLREAFTGLAEWVISTHAGTVYLHEDGAGAAIWLPTDDRTTVDELLPAPAGTGATIAQGHPLDLMLANDIDWAELNPPAKGLVRSLVGLLRSHPVPAERTNVPVLLAALGVDPEARRTGVARQLLARHHAELARHHVVTFAAAVDESGVRTYLDSGYRLHHVDHADGRLPVQWMRRTPS